MTERRTIDQALTIMHEMRPGMTFTVERDPRSGTWAFFRGPSVYVPIDAGMPLWSGAAEIAAMVIAAFEHPSAPRPGFRS